MAWRDRTNLFISYRQSTPHHPAKRPRFTGPVSNGFTGDDERQGLMSAGAFDDGDGTDTVIEMDTLPPRWLDVQDLVNEQLADIAGKTKRLEGLHQKHVLPGFDDEAVKAREEREIEDLTQDITRGFHACQRAIQRIDAMVRDERMKVPGISQGEEKMARNLKISLATRVGEVSGHFRKKQAAYLKKLRTMNGMPSSPSASPFLVQNPYNDPSLMDSEADRSFSQSTLLASREQQVQQRRNNANDALISSREREIEAIAQGVIELASIFQELNSMVIDQGSLLDRVDYNVENTLVQVKEADKELKVATNYQRRSVKRKVILLLVILVAGLFILLSLKLGRRSGGDSTSSSAIGAVTDAVQESNDGAPFDKWRRDIDDLGCCKSWRRRRRRLNDLDLDRFIL